MDCISVGRMVGNMNKWKDEPYPWHNEPVNTHPEEFKDSVWANGDRKPVHEEPCYATVSYTHLTLPTNSLV